MGMIGGKYFLNGFEQLVRSSLKIFTQKGKNMKKKKIFKSLFFLDYNINKS